MLSEQSLYRAKRGKRMVVGLRTATTSEIDAIKKQLRDHHIPFEHRLHGLRYHGVISINPKRK